MPARVRDIARARQTRNTTRNLRVPRRTSDVFLDKAVDSGSMFRFEKDFHAIDESCFPC